MAVSQSLTLTESNVVNSSNTSKVRILWKSTQSGESWNGYTRAAKYYVSINGGAETEYLVNYTLPQNSTATIVDATITVNHKSDGSGTVTVRTWMDTRISAGVVTQTKSLNLTTIPRASSLDALSCSTAYLNGTLTYKYTPKSASFYNKCVIALNLNGAFTTVKTVNIGQKAVSQQTATVTLSESELSTIYNKLPSDKKGTLRFTLTTYSNSGYSTQIGDAVNKEITLTIPDIDATQPTATMTLTQVSSLSSPFNTLYIKGKTKVTVALASGAGKYGATITSYTVNVGGVSANAPYTSGYFTKAEDVTITGTVTDSRGYSRKYTQTITVIDYSVPQILHISGESDVVAARCDSSGNLIDNGTYLKIKAKRSYSKVISGTQKNFCSIRYRYKAVGGSYSAWATILATTATSDEIVTGALLGTLDVTSSYLVQVQAVDTIGEIAETTISLPTERVYMHKAGSIGSIGIGKYAEEENTIDIAEHIATKFRGQTSFESEANFGEGASFTGDSSFSGAASFTGATSFSGNASFSGGVKLQGSNIADFIVEAGTSGIWTYRKWNSGIAECWGTASVTSTFNKTWGALYVCAPIERQNYPFTFVARPVETVTMRNKGVGCLYYVESGGLGMNTTTQTAVYCATRPTSTVEQFVFYVDYNVSGRWK